MPPLILKWKNISLAVRIKLSPDAKLVLFVICLFIMLGLIHLSTKIESRFTEVMIILGGALGVGLYADRKASKLDVEVAEKNLVQRVTDIKRAASGDRAPGNQPQGGPDGA
jgi:hypothetical protein